MTVIDAEQDDGSEAVVALAEAACPEKSPSLRELRRQVSDAYEVSQLAAKKLHAKCPIYKP